MSVRLIGIMGIVKLHISLLKKLTPFLTIALFEVFFID